VKRKSPTRDLSVLLLPAAQIAIRYAAMADRPCFQDSFIRRFFWLSHRYPDARTKSMLMAQELKPQEETPPCLFTRFRWTAIAASSDCQ